MVPPSIPRRSVLPQILGNNECFEPYTSNMYVRRVRAGEFIVVNPHLLDALVARGLWGPEMKNTIMGNGGSVRGLANVPEDLQELFKTVWEISPKVRCTAGLMADLLVCVGGHIVLSGAPSHRFCRSE